MPNYYKNWNQVLQEQLNGVKKQYLDYLTDSIFQGVNRPFVWLFGSFEDNVHQASYKRYFLPTVEKRFFNQPVQNNLRRYNNIQKLAKLAQLVVY